MLAPISENLIVNLLALPPPPIQRLRLGQLLVTPAALAALQAANVSAYVLLNRHAKRDWGNVSRSDWKQNDLAADAGLRVLSSYTLSNEQSIWIITEADRSITTVLLPDEY